tara:strand:+ start:183 stop:932 length:750 start_codon:yes stop_codon:yes gene_type:complete
MTLQNRINELFNKFNLSLETIQKSKLMAEATLENGTVINTDAETFEEGALVYVLNEEGEKIPLPEGDYKMEDGSVLSIGDSGVISKKGSGEGKGEGKGEGAKAEGNAPKTKQPAEAAPTPPAKKPPVKKSKQDKLAEDEVIEEEKKVEEEIKEEEKLMDDAYIIDLINRVLDERFPAEIVEEEMSAEDKAVTELKALLQAQTEELTTLKSQAASEGVQRVSTTKATPQVDLTSLSTEDRVKALFNKYNS